MESPAKVILSCLFVFVLFDVYGQEPKVALVLSGGGAKGFAHIGVLKVLEEEKLPISIIVGNSMGSIIGGFAAVGYSGKEIEAMAKLQNWEELLFDIIPRKYKSNHLQTSEQRYFLELPLVGEKEELRLPAGFVKGQNVLNLFCGLMANVPDSIDFKTLPISFACIATNLETGKEEVLDKGFLPKAILSSMAIPGMFSPVEYNGLYLVDGGIVNNYPSDVAQAMGADIIIGVDLQSSFAKRDKLNSVDKIITQISSFSELERRVKNRSLLDLNITPDMEGFGVSSFTKEAVDTLIKRGEKAAREKLPEIRELINKYQLKRKHIDRKFVKKQEWNVVQISTQKKFSSKELYILEQSGLKGNRHFSIDEIQTAMLKLYGVGSFEMAYPNLTKIDTNKYQLTINLDEKQNSTLKTGFGINSTDAAILNLNYTYQDFRKIISVFTIDTKIAYNPRIVFLAETHNYKLPVVGLKINAQYNELKLFTNDSEIGDFNIFNTHIDLYTYQNIKNTFLNMQIGLRSDFYYSKLNAESENQIDIASQKTRSLHLSPYVRLSYDNFDHYFLPSRGISFCVDFSIQNVFNSDYEHIPIIYSNFKSVSPLSHTLALKTKIYHRAICESNYPVTLTNYSANKYTAYNDYCILFPGQHGGSFLDKISGSFELGLQIKVGGKYYLTPLANIMTDFNRWKYIHDARIQWFTGLNLATLTHFFPVDITVGMLLNDNNIAFSGGIGFQF